MKKYKIIFWVTTGLIFLTQAVLELVTFRDPATIEAIAGLGYPYYFLPMLVGFKVVGAIVLIVPKVPARIKEWAYAGFGIDFISAFISMWVVMGVNAALLLPVVAFGILALSYVSYHKMNGSV